MIRGSLLSIVFAIFAKVVNAVSVLALTYLISQRLELAEASLFFSTIAVLMLLGPITRLGVERVLVKGFARQNDTLDRSFLLFARNAATRVLWISVGSALALFLVPQSWLADSSAWSTVSVAGFALLGINGGVFVGSVVQGLGWASSSLFLSAGALPSITAGVIYFGAFSTLKELVAAYLAASFAIFLTCGVLLIGIWRRQVNEVAPRDVSDKAHWRAATALWRVNVCTQIVQWSPQVILAAIAPAEVALLAVSQRVAMLVSFPTLAVNAVLGPKIAKQAGNGEIDQAYALVTKACVGFICYAIPMAILLWVYRIQVLELFGGAYASSGLVLLILGAGQLVACVTGPVGTYIVMTDNQAVLDNIATKTAAICILSSLIGAFFLGTVGAAVGAASAVAYQNIAAWQWSYRNHKQVRNPA